MNSKQALDRIMNILGLKSQAFYEAKTEQGMSIKIEGDLEVGAPIYVQTEEGMIPAPPGVHKLDDGTEVEVAEDGTISKIKVGDVETELEPVEEPSEEQMSKATEKFADIELKDGTVLALEGEEPSVGLRLMKKGYDGQLSAIHDGQYETKDGKVLQIVGGAIEGVQTEIGRAHV